MTEKNNFFLKIISVNIKNYFQKFAGKIGYNLLIEKEEMFLCRRNGKVDIQETAGGGSAAKRENGESAES